MKRADIEHLATLSRVRLSEAEMRALETDLSAIMSYVSVVSELAGESEAVTSAVAVVHNVLRPDVIRNVPGQYTADILSEMPHTDGKFLAVKKILHTDN